jgi:hypothetical protein
MREILKKVTYKYQTIGVRLDLTLSNNPEMKLLCISIVRRREKIKNPGLPLCRFYTSFFFNMAALHGGVDLTKCMFHQTK